MLVALREQARGGKGDLQDPFDFYLAFLLYKAHIMNMVPCETLCVNTFGLLNIRIIILLFD